MPPPSFYGRLLAARASRLAGDERVTTLMAPDMSARACIEEHAAERRW